jgi:hypothetical protein
MITLIIEAASTSEMWVTFYQTTRHNIPEDSHLRTRRRENLEYHVSNSYLYVYYRQTAAYSEMKVIQNIDPTNEFPVLTMSTVSNQAEVIAT